MDDSDAICSRCNGSGEGQYDGSHCHSCGGSGIERDYDAEMEAKYEAADRWYDERKDRACESYV